jgi:glutamate carboxypeptidase
VRIKILPTLLALALSATVHAGAFAAEANQPLLQAARQAEPAVIDSLKDMVMIESGSSDAAGLAKMADYTEARLKALGAATERQRGSTGPGSIVIGTFSGAGSKRIMLMAHMDTVYPAGTLATQPYKVEGRRIYGPGIADDKGGIAVILHALQLLKDAGWRDYGKLTVLFNADEEVGSIGSGELIASLGSEHDYVLSAEPTQVKPEGILLGASGTGTVTLQVQGRASHAGAAPDAGRNALIELSHQLVQTRDVAKSVSGTQLNWTMSQAGKVRNQIPESAMATGDMRLTVPDGFERLETALKEKVQNRLVPDTQTTVSIERGRPPFVASATAREVARKAQDIYAEMDRKLTLTDMTGGATDAGFASRSGKAVVLESFGLAGAGYHARDEYIEADTIVPRLYLMARMVQEVGRRP